MPKTILKFSRPGCVPCTVVEQLLDREGIKHTSINGLENPELCLEFNVRSFPQILVLDDNNVEQERIIGAVEHAIISLKD